MTFQHVYLLTVTSGVKGSMDIVIVEFCNVKIILHIPHNKNFFRKMKLRLVYDFPHMKK